MRVFKNHPTINSTIKVNFRQKLISHASENDLEKKMNPTILHIRYSKATLEQLV